MVEVAVVVVVEVEANTVVEEMLAAAEVSAAALAPIGTVVDVTVADRDLEIELALPVVAVDPPVETAPPLLLHSALPLLQETSRLSARQSIKKTCILFFAVNRNQNSVFLIIFYDKVQFRCRIACY